MTDGRTLVGLFLCTDRDCNVILGSAQEFLKSTGGWWLKVSEQDEDSSNLFDHAKNTEHFGIANLTAYIPVCVLYIGLLHS